jgi:two-component system response regulator ChvI
MSGPIAKLMAESRSLADMRVGELHLRHDKALASWRGKELDLTVSEFLIVSLLARRPAENMSYLEMHELLNGKGFAVGRNEEGFRAGYQVNIRAMITRVRKRFRAVDPGFDRLVNFNGFGYMWRMPEGKAADSSIADDAKALATMVLRWPVDDSIRQLCHKVLGHV